jgi:penicillin G amidase
MRTPTIEDCATQVRAAHGRAMKALTAAYGPDPAKWRWGDAHRAHFRNELYSRLPVLSALFDVGLPTDGDNFTVNRASPRVEDPSGALFDDIHGASLRALFDLADLDRSRFVIAGGQSGNPLSSHYADLTRLWRDGRSLVMVGDGQDVLRLQPEASK